MIKPFIKIIIFIILCLSITSCKSTPLKNETLSSKLRVYPDTQIGFVGDSISTGAVTDPLLFIGSTFNDRLSEFLTTLRFEDNTPILGFYPDPQKYNISLPIEPPTRIFHSEYEYKKKTKYYRDIKYFVEKKGLSTANDIVNQTYLFAH